MTRTTRIALVAVGLLMALSMLGCAGGSEPTEPAVTPPAETAEPPANGAAGGTTLNAEELVNTKCSMCHTLDRVNNADYDAAKWTTTVERMQRNGLVVSDEEKALIIEYLSTR